MDYSSDNHSSVYLLRLEHIYERHESQFLSTPATVKLKVIVCVCVLSLIHI